MACVVIAVIVGGVTIVLIGVCWLYKYYKKLLKNNILYKNGINILLK